jgi:hypothetical protein
MEKTIVLSLIVSVLAVSVPAAYAETAYQSGFRHGVDDVKKSDAYIDCIHTQSSCHEATFYVPQPGNGFDHHTTAFVMGYMKGFCLANGGGGIDVNDDENPPTLASFDCDKGLISVYPYPSDFPPLPPTQHYTACKVDIKGEPVCTYANNTN